MQRQARTPPSNWAEAVYPEVLEAQVTCRGATMLPEVSPYTLQCVNCGTAALEVTQKDVSTSTFANFVQRQGNLESCTRLLHMVTPLDEAA